MYSASNSATALKYSYILARCMLYQLKRSRQPCEACADHTAICIRDNLVMALNESFF